MAVGGATLAHGEQRCLEIAHGTGRAGRACCCSTSRPPAMSPEETVGMMESDRAPLPPKRTVILVEHKMKLVMGICQQLVVLHHGEAARAGARPERHPRQTNEVKARFISDREKNVNGSDAETRQSQRVVWAQPRSAGACRSKSTAGRDRHRDRAATAAGKDDHAAHRDGSRGGKNPRARRNVRWARTLLKEAGPSAAIIAASPTCPKGAAHRAGAVGARKTCRLGLLALKSHSAGARESAKSFGAPIAGNLPAL